MKQKDIDNAMESLFKYENDIMEHNNKILDSCGDFGDDFEALIEYCRITDKIQWVDMPEFKAEYLPERFGVFTLTHVDQWSIGDSGDSYSGFMYAKVIGKNKWLKISYDC